MGLDGETVGTGETEHSVDATVAHQGVGLGDADEIKDGLEPAPSADEEAGNEENSPKKWGEIGGRWDDFAEGEKVENSEINQPDDAGGE